MSTETTTTETTALAPNLDAVVQTIADAVQAEAKIESAEQALHRVICDLHDSHLRLGGMTDDEIRMMKAEIDAIRLRLQKATRIAGDNARIAYRQIGGAAVRHALDRFKQG